MSAPTAANGAARGIEEFGPSSVVATLLVILAYHFYGGIKRDLAQTAVNRGYKW